LTNVHCCSVNSFISIVLALFASTSFTLINVFVLITAGIIDVDAIVGCGFNASFTYSLGFFPFITSHYSSRPKFTFA